MLKFLVFAAVATLVNCRAGIFGDFFGGNSIESPQETKQSDSRIVGGETSPVHYPYQGKKIKIT